MKSTLHQIGSAEQAPPHFALFQLGFRPFFLGAGVVAVSVISLWIYLYFSGVTISHHYSNVQWHSHEMVFGFATAIMAGFLLMAVKNWTGIATVSGRSLALLVVLWLAGRLLVYLPLPELVLVVVDLLFLPVLAFLLWRPLWAAKQKRNFFMPVMLLVMGGLNTLFHLNILGLFSALSAFEIINAALWLIVLLMVVMSGRVMPFFMEKGLRVQCKKWRWLEVAAITGVILLALLELRSVEPIWLAFVSLLVTLLHIARLSGWWHNAAFSVPLLWVLQVGYLWLIVGFFFKALVALNLLMPLFAVHALAMGGLGVIGLGMMARVALGHTGRALETHWLMNWAFIAVNLAVLIRVVMAPLFMQYYTTWIALSGFLWVLGFSLFLWVYLPILIRPRVDGKLG